MSGFFSKQVGEDLACAVAWQAGSLASGEDVTDDLGWTVAPVEGPEDLRILTQVVDKGASRITVAGGVPGRTYLVTGTVGTDRGRRLTRSLIVRVEDAI